MVVKFIYGFIYLLKPHRAKPLCPFPLSSQYFSFPGQLWMADSAEQRESLDQCAHVLLRTRGALQPPSPSLHLLLGPRGACGRRASSSPVLLRLYSGRTVAAAFGCGINNVLIIAGTPLFTSTVIFDHGKPFSLGLWEEGATIIFFFFLNLFILFIYFWLCWVFVAACRLSLVAASGGCSSLWCVGFSLRWLLLLWSTGSRRTGFSSCGTWAQ